MTFLTTNSLVGGAIGSAVTIANSDDNGAGTQFSTVAGNVVYGAETPGGGRSLLLTQGSTAGQSKIRWAGAAIGENVTAGMTRYVRMYIFLTAYPPGNELIVQWRDAAVPSNAAALRLETNGKVSIMESDGDIVATTANPIPLNKMIRVEFKVVFNATGGSAEARFHWRDGTHLHGYNSKTVSATITAASMNSLGTADEVSIGLASSVANYSMRMFAPAVSDIGWVGPLECPTVYVLTGGVLTPQPYSLIA